MLEKLRQYGEKLSLPHEDVINAVAKPEGVIRHHLDYSGYENQWVALLTGCQDVANQFAVMVASDADDFQKTLAELEEEGSSDPGILRGMEGLSRCIAFMRLVLTVVHQAGELVAA